MNDKSKFTVGKRDDSNSSSSLLSRTTTTKKFTLKLTDVDSKQSKSSKNTSRIRYKAGGHDTTGVITEHTEEDYASVFESNRRTVDLVK